MKPSRYGEYICNATTSEMNLLRKNIVSGRRVRPSRVSRLQRLVKYGARCDSEHHDIVKTILWFDEEKVLTT